MDKGDIETDGRFINSPNVPDDEQLPFLMIQMYLKLTR